MAVLCDRCKEEIKRANNLDKDCYVDRFHRTVNGIKLGPKEWEFFSLLYLYKRPVTKEEFEDYIFGKDITFHALRNYIYKLRLKLANTPFKIANFHNYSYEL